MSNFREYWRHHELFFNDQEINPGLENLYKDLKEAENVDRRVFTAGNGGSAATAEHFAADLNLNLIRTTRSISALCLTSQIATVTALANDIGYEQIFSKQINNHARMGDIVILFTASGNSNNIITQIKSAKNMGLKIHVFCGFDGGEVASLPNINLILTRSEKGLYGQIENLHSAMCHYLVDKLIQDIN